MSSISSCEVMWAEVCLTTLPHMLLSHRQIPHLFAQCVILREARITHNSKRYYLCFCYRVHDLYVLSLAIAQAYALVKTSLQTVPIRQNRRKSCFLLSTGSTTLNRCISISIYA